MSVQPPMDKVRPLKPDEAFNFGCGPGLSCFTDCCRALDLALTPYDAFRLRQALKLSSADFLEQYAVVETGEDEAFPLVYLAMVDDGQASCPFVAAAGCKVYRDRPAACRAYPMGRGLRLAAGCRGPRKQEIFVLVKEPHCLGFEVEQSRDAGAWMADQGLQSYNRNSDTLLQLLRHPKIMQGWRPSPGQAELYLQTLYQLEDFQTRVIARQVDLGPELAAAELPATTDPAVLTAEELLPLAINWLRRQFDLN